MMLASIALHGRQLTFSFEDEQEVGTQTRQQTSSLMELLGTKLIVKQQWQAALSRHT